MVRKSTLRITISGLLIAFGIVIPMFSPFKIVIPPASFTLASHVPIFIAMFISPFSAIAVAAGTTIGFALGSFPPVIVLRAASHVIFAALGALYWQKSWKAEASAFSLRTFSFTVGLIHAVSELVVVSMFYLTGMVDDRYYDKGFLLSVVILVGAGTVIHSMVDFEIAYLIKKVKAVDRLTITHNKVKRED